MEATDLLITFMRLAMNQSICLVASMATPIKYV